MDINKIISIVRSIKEEGSPTMNLGAGKIAGTVESGDDPPVTKKKRKYASGGKGSRKFWMDYLNHK
jgi:hypothetical protein